jgi:hypothetical protein
MSRLGSIHERGARREYGIGHPGVLVHAGGQDHVELSSQRRLPLDVSTQLVHVVVILVTAVDRGVRDRNGSQEVEAVHQPVAIANSRHVLKLPDGQPGIVNQRSSRSKEIRAVVRVPVQVHLGEQVAPAKPGLDVIVGPVLDLSGAEPRQVDAVHGGGAPSGQDEAGVAVGAPVQASIEGPAL